MRLGTNGIIAIGTLCLIGIMVGAITHQPFSYWVFPFSLLFGAIFLGVLVHCFLDYRLHRFQSTSVENHPNEPWMWDPRWQTDVMVSRSRSELWGTLAFTIIVGMFAVFGVATLFKGLPEGNLWVLLNIIPIVAAAYLGQSTYVAWRTFRLEKHISLTSDIRPAWIGKKFSGVIAVSNGSRPDHFKVWLEHFKIIRQEESDGVSFSKIVDRKLPGHTEFIGDDKTQVSIDIPEKSPATSWHEDEQKRWWDLVVETEIFGKKILLRYEVPVADPADHENSGAQLV